MPSFRQLRRTANVAANARGHRLQWCEPDGSTQAAYCLVCGHTVTIDTEPLPHRHAVTGAAYRQPCPTSPCSP